MVPLIAAVPLPFSILIIKSFESTYTCYCQGNGSIVYIPIWLLSLETAAWQCEEIWKISRRATLTHVFKYSKNSSPTSMSLTIYILVQTPWSRNGDRKTSWSNKLPLVLYTFWSSPPSYTDITQCLRSTVPHKKAAFIHQTVFQDQVLF